MGRWVVGVLVVAAATFVLSGCGSGDGSSTRPAAENAELRTADVAIKMLDTGNEDGFALIDELSPTVGATPLGMQVTDLTNNPGTEMLYLFLAAPLHRNQKPMITNALLQRRGVQSVEFDVVPIGSAPVQR